MTTASERVSREQNELARSRHSDKIGDEKDDNFGRGRSSHPSNGISRRPSSSLVSAHAAVSRRKYLESVGYDEDLKSFLQTITSPQLYWKPVNHNDATSKMLEDQIALREQRQRVIASSLKQKLADAENEQEMS